MYIGEEMGFSISGIVSINSRDAFYPNRKPKAGEMGPDL